MECDAVDEESRRCVLTESHELHKSIHDSVTDKGFECEHIHRWEGKAEWTQLYLF